MRSPITLFTFGYWGWGTVTDKLVAATDAIEASRGYKPPIFVDIRIRNRTRAPGFSGNTFRDLIGVARFRWMPKLGNRAVIDDSAYSIVIDDPAAAKELLDLAIQAAGDDRRVIFFCACKHPVEADSYFECHRTTVAKLVLKEAKKRGLKLEVVEWPGGAPKAVDLRVERSVFRQLEARMRGTGSTQNIALGRALPDPEWLGLPYGSIIIVRNGRQALAVMSGPATFAGKKWQVPAMEVFDYTDEQLEKLLSLGVKRQKAWGRSSASSLPTRA